MPSFDIGTLLDFQPPKFFCEKCKGILLNIAGDWESKFSTCPICGVKYIYTKEYPWFKVGSYLANNDFGIIFDDPVEQGRILAAIAHNFSKNTTDYPPMRALFEAISAATSFIHFTTYGLSRTLYGALKLKAQSISVRGIASNIQPDFAKEIREGSNEAPRLELLLFEQSPSSNDWEKSLIRNSS